MMDPKTAADAYSRLIIIRLTEEAIAEEYKQQEMKCPVHLSIGQEAVAAGVSLCLSDQDVVFSTHRCHSHYLAKNGDLNRMIAELYGKKEGCAKGLGGSMHLIDEGVGMMGSSAIVGGSIPLAVGAALSFKMFNQPHIAVPYFGDGACEEGVFHESLNFAALKKLPVIFVCENNAVATSSPLLARRPANNIFQHGQVFGIPGYQVDGNDLASVYATAKRAREHAASGKGPVLIEARTYRIMGHVGPQQDCSSGLRTQEEWDQWKDACPIKRFEAYCDEKNLLSESERETMRRSTQLQIQEAFEIAKAGAPAEWIA
ncbi:MAG: thiamine pyrophosphate-dependent dehydrogenase E1 component subunit alpha [Candidatus Nitrohelix vancouverensis]|uniref:Thiamine pyrophosphate-dependent dehydrogenase E1 component subunit alpha n=1 Tax=Candidatus Nitrohelix vancouverensis TaxID=2705534 RepID=A0A7T0G3G1_9BACT|nr:MAG: thiamine pyrophosphate-dependent dehydrogenase E1 component subunit alpha [Candidatus Nitrohelix vancouverensis]